MSQTDIVLDLYDSMDADLAKVPTLYSPAQRATQQEIEIAKLQHKIEALQAAQDEIRQRPMTPAVQITKSRQRTIRGMKNATWQIITFCALALIFSGLVAIVFNGAR